VFKRLQQGTFPAKASVRWRTVQHEEGDRPFSPRIAATRAGKSRAKKMQKLWSESSADSGEPGKESGRKGGKKARNEEENQSWGKVSGERVKAAESFSLRCSGMGGAKGQRSCKQEGGSIEGGRFRGR